MTCPRDVDFAAFDSSGLDFDPCVLQGRVRTFRHRFSDCLPANMPARRAGEWFFVNRVFREQVYQGLHTRSSRLHAQEEVAYFGWNIRHSMYLIL